MQTKLDENERVQFEEYQEGGVMPTFIIPVYFVVVKSILEIPNNI